MKLRARTWAALDKNQVPTPDERHRSERRCESLTGQRAIGWCAAVLVAALAAVTCAGAGQTTAPAFDSNRAWEHLQQIVSIGPRPAGSAALEQTRRYIRSQLASAGVTVTDQTWEAQTPVGPVRMVNLIATIPGQRSDRIVLSGHYDTKLFRTGRFVGANDGGSSAAFLLEAARALSTRRNPLTIEVLFLDGEEAFCLNWDDCSRPGAPDNTYGSRYYVAMARQRGTLAGIKANILVDMVADRDLRLKRDLNSTPWLTDLIWSAAERLKFDAYFVPETTEIEDDHIPFVDAGVPSVDLIDLDYPAWHTPGDTLEAVSARSLQVVGDAVFGALPDIEVRLR